MSTAAKASGLCPRCARLEHDDLADLTVPPELTADDAERIAVLLEELPAMPAAACKCARPIVAADAEGDRERCWKCGHSPNGTHS